MYYLKRKIKRGKVASLGKIEGLKIKPKSGKNIVKVKWVTICDKLLSEKYAEKQLNKKIAKLHNVLYKFLMSEDDSETGVKICIGEIEKTKSIIFNKYKEHMKNQKYKDFLAKMVITENEFRNKYLEREYLIKLMNSRQEYYEEDELERGRGR